MTMLSNLGPRRARPFQAWALLQYQVHPFAVAEAHDGRVENEHLVERLWPSSRASVYTLYSNEYILFILYIVVYNIIFMISVCVYVKCKSVYVYRIHTAHLLVHPGPTQGARQFLGLRAPASGIGSWTRATSQRLCYPSAFRGPSAPPSSPSPSPPPRPHPRASERRPTARWRPPTGSERPTRARSGRPESAPGVLAAGRIPAADQDTDPPGIFPTSTRSKASKNHGKSIKNHEKSHGKTIATQ